MERLDSDNPPVAYLAREVVHLYVAVLIVAALAAILLAFQ